MTDPAGDGRRTCDYRFNLPKAQIATHPAPQRDASRLMYLDAEGHPPAHRHFTELPDLLNPGDLLVLNDTRVYPARINGHKPRTGGAIELLLVEPLGPDCWKAMLRGRLKAGERITLEGGLHGQVTELLGGGFAACRFADTDVLAHLAQHGHIPLPPYIARPDDAADRDRYQTVFAKDTGSVAAPTSGLHFTDEILATLKARGVDVAFVTLHVGPGTFLPVRVDHIDQHVMHAERYHISAATAQDVADTQARGGRIIACGTTVTRTLEHVAHTQGKVVAGSGSSDLFITPGFKFKVIDALITNFHLPESTLLMLVAALVGRERILAAYAEAVTQGYRFFSYGDATLAARRPERHEAARRPTGHGQMTLG